MQHLSGIDRARIALERGDRVPGGALPALVAESWQRCRELGLDPRGAPQGEVIAQSEVSRRRDAVAALRRLALGEMKSLHNQIAGSNVMIALADAEGMVLDTISDAAFADSEAGRSIIPGSLWGERLRGTNALGLGVLTGSPVAVYGREHYFARHQHLSCMAAPILDPRGRILGLLDASCSNEARQQHTHALVRMAASQIEIGLIFQEQPESFIFAFHPRAEYLATLSAGLIALSRDGEVLSLNRAGSALLAGLVQFPAVHFDELFETSFRLVVTALLRGGAVPIRDRAGSGIFMVCRQIGRGLSVPARAAGPARPVAAEDRCEPDFPCADPTLREALVKLPGATRRRLPIHLHGETGTGKDLMARHVHKVSGRTGEFVAVNCGAIPESLFVAEFFGHERGAFTHARSEGSPGLVRAADGGTLFLDEVADIPLAAQTALLRFLDSMEVRPVGGQKTHSVDVQIVSATNRSLEDLVSGRAFRADLLYRLNTLTIVLPPLSRRLDFAAIVRHLIAELAPGLAITDAAVERLRRRSWPGNVRELKSALQRAILEGPEGFLDEDSIAGQRPEPSPDSACPACRGNPLRARACAEIRATFSACNGNVSMTSRKLGISRTTLYKHLDARPPREDGSGQAN